MVALTPLIVRLLTFHELIYVPRLVDCQQKVPTPSCVNGAVMVAVTGLQVFVTIVVGVTDGATVRVGVAVIGPAVGVRVRVTVGPPGVRVRVEVLVMPAVGVRVTVRVAVLVTAGAVLVRVGVLVTGPVVFVGTGVPLPPVNGNSYAFK